MPTLGRRALRISWLLLSCHVKKMLRLAGAAAILCALALLAARGSGSNSVPAQATQPMRSKPSDAQLRGQLSSLQYEVTQKNGTEPPFDNAFWNATNPGIYVDIVSGEPLFSSLDKFKSDCGWPSFTQPVEGAALIRNTDNSHGMSRVEVRSPGADSHLGHVFNDGPGPTKLRYCINSASLRFVPVEKMAAEGYGAQLEAFVLAGLAKPSGKEAPLSPAAGGTNQETATFAGGCFWGMQEILRAIPGVVSTRVGYTGGTVPNPTYDLVCSGLTGHAESVEITFDPGKLTYEKLLDFFFRMHDPTTLNRQHNDAGTQYRSAIFYHSEEQRETAERVRAAVDKSGKWPNPVATQIVQASRFYEAEQYHQDYLQKHPDGYTCHFLRD